MTADELKWLVGQFVTIGGAFLATIGGLRKAISNGDEKLADKMSKGDDALHERVNRVRDEYVKRVDHDAALTRIDLTLRELRDEQKEMNRQVLAALPRPRRGGAT